ncbi:hypothetical protein EAF00_000133 [Botryotinia globosa]|nr:hypothetical protein EAF00_000133 [Botryotinia globosa]
MHCTCQGHFNCSLSTLGVVLYGIYKILTYVCIETSNTLLQKKPSPHSFSKDEGVIFASQCFGGGSTYPRFLSSSILFEDQIVTSGVPAKLRTESYKRSDPPES